MDAVRAITPAEAGKLPKPEEYYVRHAVEEKVLDAPAGTEVAVVIGAINPELYWIGKPSSREDPDFINDNLSFPLPNLAEDKLEVLRQAFKDAGWKAELDHRPEEKIKVRLILTPA